jgi:hypothetical protein
LPIRLLLGDDHSFGPAEIEILVAAYEDALAGLRLSGRDDSASRLIAKRIMYLAMDGERDPIRLRDGAIRHLLVTPAADGRTELPVAS